MKKLLELTNLPEPTLRRIIKELLNEKNNVLREITGFSRNRIFVFEEYLELFRS